MAGFSPIRVMMASDLCATFTIAKISTIHGSTSSPEGTVDTTENSILQQIRLNEYPRGILDGKCAGRVLLELAQEAGIVGLELLL